MRRRAGFATRSFDIHASASAMSFSPSDPLRSSPRRERATAGVEPLIRGLETALGGGKEGDGA